MRPACDAGVRRTRSHYFDHPLPITPSMNLKRPNFARGAARRGVARSTRQAVAAARALQLVADQLGWDGITVDDPTPRDDVLICVQLGLLPAAEAAFFFQGAAPVAPVGQHISEHAAAALLGEICASAGLAAAEEAMFTQGADCQARATLRGAARQAGPCRQLDPNTACALPALPAAFSRARAAQ